LSCPTRNSESARNNMRAKRAWITGVDDLLWPTLN
jgi:hypothetical protein